LGTTGFALTLPDELNKQISIVSKSRKIGALTLVRMVLLDHIDSYKQPDFTRGRNLRGVAKLQIVLPNELNERLEAIAKPNGLMKSTLIRKILSDHIMDYECVDSIT